ncbi:MAG: peptide chain release factor 2 [Deltaproteobacteria bacterium RBG_13_43_22]|nr:MAG: peptide chain release factor 2 [Deltaproteobacteria bacterium RBG_13_43_22]
MISKNNLWDNPDQAKTIFKERGKLIQIISEWEQTQTRLEETEILLDLALAEVDQETLSEVQNRLKDLEKLLAQMEFNKLLSGEEDACHAIMAIHAGAGGTEAQDWAEMLLRMYLRWSERRGFKTEIIDQLPGDEAGIKSVTFTIEGKFAYGYLRSETGIHRLVRISPFDAGGRRHTSFASVFVYPEVEDDIQIEINEADVRVDTFRASGAGGQHVNKTSSAIRLTHLPTGIVVQCQNEKSQHRNKDMAFKVLKSRLYELELEKKEEKKKEIHEGQADIAWGSQIRSYTLAPYRLVKDHRSQLDIGNVDDVLDGGIDPFIEAFLWLKNK